LNTDEILPDRQPQKRFNSTPNKKFFVIKEEFSSEDEDIDGDIYRVGRNYLQGKYWTLKEDKKTRIQKRKTLIDVNSFYKEISKRRKRTNRIE